MVESRQSVVHATYRSKKGKGKFLYSAVSSPQDRSKRFTLYFPDRPVHSDTISASLGSIQPYATVKARRLLVDISTTVYIARYSCIQLSELEQYRVKKLAQGFNTAAQDSNSGSRSQESEALPPSHCALEEMAEQSNFHILVQGLFATEKEKHI